MIFDLVQDYADALEAMPREHKKHRMLELLDEALRRDIHFTDRHPTTLFQNMWNLCWWYDNPEAEKHYVAPEEGWSEKRAPWLGKFALLLSKYMSYWRAQGRVQKKWARKLLPPKIALGNRLKNSFSIHKQGISCVAISPSGNAIASSSFDGSIRVFDKKGVPISLFQYEYWFSSVEFSPDGNKLACGCQDGRVFIIDPSSGARLLASNQNTHTGWIRDVSYSPDGERIAIATQSGTIHIWNIDTCENIAIYGHEKPVSSISFHPDGEIFASGSEDGTVRIWSTNGTLQHEYTISKKEVWSVKYSPDGNKLAIASDDGNIYQWDICRGVLEHVLTGHSRSVNEIAYDSGTKFLSSVSSDGYICIWDVNRGIREKHWKAHCAYGVVFSHNGSEVITGGYLDNSINIWNAARDFLDANVTLYREEKVRCVQVERTGNYIACGSHDGMISVYDINKVKMVSMFGVEQDYVLCLDFTSDGKRLVSGHKGGSVRIWDVQQGELLEAYKDHHDPVVCLSCDNNGGPGILSASKKKAIVQSGCGKRVLKNTSYFEVGNVILSLYPDIAINGALNLFSVCLEGQKATTISRDGKYRNWNVATGECICTYELPVEEYKRVLASDYAEMLQTGVYVHPPAILSTNMESFPKQISDTNKYYYIDNTYALCVFEVLSA